MKLFSLCQKWLFIVSLIISVFGIVLALFNQTTFFNLLFNNQVNPVFWKAGEFSHQAMLFQQWIYGVLGATCFGWGVILAFIIKYPFKRKEMWSWYCMLLGIAVWFITDTSISIYFSVIFNAAFNCILAISILIPLLLTKKYFKIGNI